LRGRRDKRLEELGEGEILCVILIVVAHVGLAASGSPDLLQICAEAYTYVTRHPVQFSDLSFQDDLPGGRKGKVKGERRERQRA
jgi:hypothetical protein